MVLEAKLVNYILAQHAESDAFEAEAPGNWMGRLPSPQDTAYWTARVPTGTFAEFNRIELEESAYYATADAYSKSYARSFDFSTMSDAQLEAVITEACNEMDYQHKAEEAYKKAEELKMTELANSLNVDMNTLNRWMEAA
jgi:hypothetical protein